MTAVNPVLQENDRITLADYRKRFGGEDGIAEVAETLNESNEVMQDIVYKEGNMDNGDRQTYRLSLPDVYEKVFNKGTKASKSSVGTVEETCALIEARAEVDVDLAELNGQAPQLRAQEDKAFIEAIAQKETYLYFKGNTDNGNMFDGFERRYNTLNQSKDLRATNVIDASNKAGASALKGKKLSSIWLIGWGDDVYSPYPKGSKMGLRVEDKGAIFLPDEEGNVNEVYTTMYKKSVGLMVKDWRKVVRICNIDVDMLRTNQGVGNPDLQKQGWNLITLMLDAITKLPADAKGNFKFYMNRDVFASLNSLSLRSDTNVIEWKKATDAFGKNGSWANFQGIPMRRVDQLTNDEAIVS